MTRIYCIHPSVKDIASFLDFAGLASFASPAELQWDEKAPDILFATEWIYYKSAFFSEFRRLYRSSGIKVGLMGEAVAGDLNLFDYVIGFDRGRDADPRFIRLPAPSDMFHRFLHRSENEIVDKDSAAALLAAKPGFCNFLYSNAAAHPMRDRLFYALGAVDRVDSLGRHLNNVGTEGTGYGHGHAAECTDIKAPYRFSIACENAEYRGYATEKALTSLEAHTVPIYWGNPDIAEDINPKAIIDVRALGGIEAAVEKVREVNADPELWASMVAEPWFTAEQLERNARRTSDYRAGMLSLLSGKAERQVPEGYHVEMYRSHLLKGDFPFEPRWKKILGI